MNCVGGRLIYGFLGVEFSRVEISVMGIGGFSSSESLGSCSEGRAWLPVSQGAETGCYDP